MWSALILLLLLAAAGWFAYNIQRNDVKVASKAGHHLPSPNRLREELSGRVLQYGTNPEGDIDKILLDAAGKKYWLHFPPHTARAVTSVAPVNNSIDVTADQSDGPGPHAGSDYEVRFLRNRSKNKELDMDQIPSPEPRKGMEVIIEGNVSDVLRRSMSEKQNFELSGRLISMPPHMARELLPLIRKAEMIKVKGNLRDSTSGFLSATGMPVVRPTMITLDSITYKIR